MQSIKLSITVCALFVFSSLLSACVSYPSNMRPSGSMQAEKAAPSANYASRLPQHIDTHGEKVVVIDPRVHAWGAYDASGNLLRAGLATAGSSYCADIHRACRTKVGTFRVYSLGSLSCKSTRYPIPKGGAPMPYCMYFNGNQGLHGTYGGGVVEGNVSHGCVRVKVVDAEWLRYSFINVGTKVIVKPY